MSHTLRLKAKALPVLAALALIMQIIDPSRVWVMLLIGLGGLWGVCLWWTRGLARSLTFTREVRFGWAQVGDKLEERFTLTNAFGLPAPLVTILDHSTLPDHHGSLATGVDARDRFEMKIKSQCTRRGIYTLGGTTLETGDPLGVYALTLEDPACSTLVVTPPIVSLPDFRIASKGRSLEGRATLRSFEETVNTSHLREKVPSDPMRLIHWKSTARQQKFIVRQFEQTTAGNRWILLDLHAACQLGQGWDSTEEHAVVLAASLASAGLQEGIPIGLGINSGTPEWIVPRQNETQLQSMLMALARAAPSAMDLRAYLQCILSSVGRQSSLLVVTADPDPTWVEALLPFLRRGILPTVFVLDPLTFGGATSVTALQETLQSIGASCHVIPREFFDPRQLHPGVAGEWEWRVFGTGKAVAVRSAHANWRRLA